MRLKLRRLLKEQLQMKPNEWNKNNMKPMLECWRNIKACLMQIKMIKNSPNKLES